MQYLPVAVCKICAPEALACPVELGNKCVGPVRQKGIYKSAGGGYATQAPGLAAYIYIVTAIAYYIVGYVISSSPNISAPKPLATAAELRQEYIIVIRGVGHQGVVAMQHLVRPRGGYARIAVGSPAYIYIAQPVPADAPAVFPFNLPEPATLFLHPRYPVFPAGIYRYLAIDP